MTTLSQSPSGTAFVEPQHWLGDCHPLVEQLGSAGGLVAPDAAAATLQLGPVRDRVALREFLRAYHAELLLPVELPAIRRAWGHATGNEFRELARFDCALRDEARLQPFATASQAAGQRQLRRFRPLRDVRLVQRYLAAMEREEVQAWHTLVYGVTMWLFSLPLHQGLLGYARQVTRGFIRAAAEDVGISAREGKALFEELAGPLAAAVPAVVAATAPS